MDEHASYDLRTDETVPRWIRDAASDASGRRPHPEPTGRLTGGPAGNARLTAWLGLALTALLLVELVTLLDVRGLLSWHAAVGTAVGALVVAKTASTGWRMVGYYRGARPYRAAGPPSMFFRVLGPFMVLTTLGVVGTGIALVVLGTDASRTTLVDALGQRVDAVTLHQATFVLFAIAIALHFLGRIVPAVQRVTSRTRVPGSVLRTAALVVTGVVAVVGALLVLPLSAGWR